MNSTRLITVLCALFLTVAPSPGAVIHSESINGDLSGIFASPTPLTLALGANTILAQIGNNGDTGATNNARDADYFTVTIGAGQALISLTVDSFTFGPNNPGVSFAGYVAAAAFAGQAQENIDGSAFFNASSGNILDDFTGGLPPLSAGVYSFWFQETSANVVNYQLTLNVVPEPSTALLGVAGVALMLTCRRRLRSTARAGFHSK
jgi:hypothetical protein